MKKGIISTVFFLLMFAYVAVAQNITLEAGYFNPKRSGNLTGESYFDAIRLGATYVYDWRYNIGFQTGLLFNTGYSHNIQKYSTSGDSVIYRTWDIALEIPIRAMYHQTLFKDFRIFGFAGPNIQIGLIQPQRIDAHLTPALQQLTGIQSDQLDLYRTETQHGLHRVNFQLGVGGGIQWRSYLLKSGYDWGINNLHRNSPHRLTQGHWYVTFGYQIR